MSNPTWPLSKMYKDGGYINNPFHTDEPGRTDKHYPCGYWPVELPSTDQVKPPGGTLYGSGYGLNHRMGNSAPGVTGDALNRVVFDKIVNDTYYKKVSAGGSHTLIITNYGAMWGIGANQHGCLGLGDEIARTSWEQISGIWTDVSTSPIYTHSLAIKNDGTLWATGYNNYGQLGLGGATNRNTWEQVGTASNWISVKTGSYFTMALNSAGNLYSCGNSYQGALGLGDTLKRDVLTGALNSVSQVSCGYYFTGVIGIDGSVWMTGSNNDGQFGIGNTTPTESFVQISDAGRDNAFIECGGYYSTAYSGSSFLIKNSGIMWAAGSNQYNLMGLPGGGDETSFVQLDGTGWESVANKRTNTLAIKTNGEMWGTGYNNNGELGLGDKGPRSAFERIGSDLWLAADMGAMHSMAINWDGVYDWG